MKNTFWLFLGMMAVMITMFTACQARSDFSQPKPSPTVQSVATDQIIETPVNTPLSTIVEVTHLPSDSLQREQTRYIILYKSVIAGDYYALRITGDGLTEFTNYSRAYTIGTYKQGNLSSEQTRDLFAFLVDQRFFTLKDEYHLPTPQPDAPEEKYEDVYYWVEAFDGQRKKIILSHEYASPPELEKLIQALFNAVVNLPDSEIEGDFLLSVDYQILPYLRREEGILRLQLDEQSAKEYPALERSLYTPGSVVRIQSSIEPKTRQLFSSEAHMMEVVFSEKRFLVLLLTTE